MSQSRHAQFLYQLVNVGGLLEVVLILLIACKPLHAPCVRMRTPSTKRGMPASGGLESSSRSSFFAASNFSESAASTTNLETLVRLT